MTPTRRVAFIGNSLPRRCGIATFTTDLQQAIAASGRDFGHRHRGDDRWRSSLRLSGQSVRLQIHDEKLEDYRRAAQFLNAGQFDVVCLQHEFGIFGGDAGSHIVTLLANLNSAVVTTLHTVLAAPSPAQRRVLRQIADASSTVIVMAEKGRAVASYRV